MITRPNFLMRAYWRLKFKNDCSEAAVEISRALEWNTSYLLAAIKNDALIGALLYHESVNYIHIAHLGSLERGTGSALLLETLAMKKQTTLYCRDKNAGFYEKFGFLKIPGPPVYMDGTGFKMINALVV